MVMQSRKELVERLVEGMELMQAHMRARPPSAWSGLDLTMPQAKTLFYLADGPRRMSGISDRLGVGMPSATSMIDRLVSKGLVEREQDPSDRRVVVCSLTGDGRDAVERFWRLGRNRTESLAAVLTTAELEVVVPAMEMLADAAGRDGFRSTSIGQGREAGEREVRGHGYRRGDGGSEPMRVVLRLTKYAFRHKWYLVGAYAAMVASTLSAMVIPRMLGSAIDEALASGLQSRLLLLAGVILLFSALRGVFSFAQRYLSESLSQRSAYDLRNDFFKKLQGMSFGFFDREQTGNLMSKATQDVEAVRMFISMGMVRGLSIFVMLGAVAGLMVATNWRLAIVSMIFVPPILWRALAMSRVLRPTWMKVQAETGALTTVLQENLAGMKVVKAFGAHDFEEGKFNKKADSVANLTYSATRLFASQGSLMTFIFTAATGAILWYGGREVAADRLSPGELAAFILYMGLLGMPIRMSGWMVNTVSRAASAGQRLYDVLDAESPVTEKPDAAPLPRVSGRVAFRNVSVSYDEDMSAVRNIDFDVQPGQMVALLGGPGSGKSTIAHVIPRFYDVAEGRIEIDGVDVRDVTLASLRKNVGVVMQDVFVFAATIKDNIAYGLDEVDMDEVVRAAKIAQLHDFIEGLPDGYDSWVGERGITLSGGQRQRLAIARTILLDPPVLILDDSTSSVDMATEHKLQEALNEVIRGRTTFVIAHRLSTVRSADVILVLEDGKVVERGTHAELLEDDGFYRSIYDMQLRTQEDETAPAPALVAGGGA